MPDTKLKQGLFSATLRGKPEDKITEVVAWLLRHPRTKMLMFKALFPDIPHLDGWSVDTQYRTFEGARPDLVFSWPEKQWWVEVKFEAPTTARQKSSYSESRAAEEIPVERFFFLAPLYRQAELTKLISSAEDGFVSWEAVHDRLEEMLPKHTIKGRSLFWLEELLIAIRDEVGMHIRYNPEDSDSAKQLQDGSFGKAFGAYIDLVELMYRWLRSQKEPFKPIHKPRPEYTKSGFALGFEVESPEGVHLWLGFWTWPWLRYDKSPLWISLFTDEEDEGVYFRFLEKCRDDAVHLKAAESWCIPIRFRADGSEQEVREEILGLLSSVRKDLVAGGIPDKF